MDLCINIAVSLPYPFFIPTINSLPASGLIPRTLLLDHFFWASRFLFLLAALRKVQRVGI